MEKDEHNNRKTGPRIGNKGNSTHPHLPVCLFVCLVMCTLRFVRTNERGKEEAAQERRLGATPIRLVGQGTAAAFAKRFSARQRKYFESKFLDLDKTCNIGLSMTFGSFEDMHR